MINKELLKQNFIYVLISIFLAILALSTIILIDYGKNQKNIIITSEDGNSLQISDIKIGGSTYPLNEFNQDKIKYNEEYNFLELSPDAEFKIEASYLEDVNITFIKNKGNGKAKIDTLGKETTIETDSKQIDFEKFTSSTTVKEILYSYLKNINVKKACIYVLSIIFLGILYFLIIKLIMHILENIKSENSKWYNPILLQLCFIVLFSSSIYLLLEIFNYFIIIPEILFIGFLIKKYKDSFKKAENVFLIFSIFLGLNFAFILPPYHVPDEGAHFIKAYSLTLSKEEKNNDIKDINTNDANIILPKSIASSTYFYNLNIHSIDYKVSAKKILADYSLKLDKKNKNEAFTWFGNTSTLNSFCYIPSAIMISFVNLFNGPVIMALTLCRIINLTLFVIIGYYSIKMIPRFKKTLLLIALLPVAIQQAAAVNQDSITNTIVILTFAYIIKCIYNKEDIKLKDTIFLCIMSILLSFVKFVYFPIMFLTILIPKEKFKSSKEKWLSVGTIIFISLFLTLRSIFLLRDGISLETLSKFYTFSTVLHHPFRTAHIFLNTFLDRFQLDTLGGLVNGFGWSTKWGKNLYAEIMQNMFLLLFLLPEKNSAKEPINIKMRIALFINAFLIIGLVYSSLLIGWTSIDSSTVQGLQSRYFIPAVLLLVCSINSNIIKVQIKDMKKFYIICLLISTAITIFTLTEGFYI